MSEIRLACLVSHPIQYQAPLFRKLTLEEDIDLTVYFCSKQGVKSELDEGFGKEVAWDVPLLDGYSHVFLPNRSPLSSNEHPIGEINPSVVKPIRKNEFDVLWVHGYSSVTTVLGLLAAWYHGIPMIVRGETTPHDDASSLATAVKNAAFHRLFENVTALAYIGTLNKKFYRSLDVEPDKLFFAPYSVDNEFFRRRKDELESAVQLRADEGLATDRPVVLFVGKLLKRKRPSVLLDAFVEATEPGDATLLFVGDGIRREVLERRAVCRQRANDIRFTGFVNQSELPKYYKMADVFVLPSAVENWGLVINEAMNFSLPIITTSTVGCAVDLVDERNGRVVPPDDVASLSRALSTVLRDPDCRESMGKVSYDRISDWGVDRTATGIAQAARYCCSRRT